MRLHRPALLLRSKLARRSARATKRTCTHCNTRKCRWCSDSAGCPHSLQDAPAARRTPLLKAARAASTEFQAWNGAGPKSCRQITARQRLKRSRARRGTQFNRDSREASKPYRDVHLPCASAVTAADPQAGDGTVRLCEGTSTHFGTCSHASSLCTDHAAQHVW